MSLLTPTPESGSAPATFNISRRSFLKRCAVLAAATGLPLWFVERQLVAAEAPARKRRSPNGRPGIALIGTGNMGKQNGGNAMNHGDIVAVCDVDERRVAEAAEKFTPEGGRKPDIYSDFRKVLERDDVHLIANSTPDHWHTLINLAAIKAGKDILSEKPLTLTIDEGRRLVKAVRESGTVLQTNSWQRSVERFRLACELVRNGRIGRLQQVDVWLPAGWQRGPFSPSPVPAGFNWDFWQGQAPAHEYVVERTHRTFRHWYDYSGGEITDWGAHMYDIAAWAIGDASPRQIESQRLSEPIPGGYTVYAEFTVKFTYDNGLVLNTRSTRDADVSGVLQKQGGQGTGVTFVGSNGWIWVARENIKASDMDLVRTPLPENAERLYRSNDHWKNFVDCADSRKDPICNVDVGNHAANMCHLAGISLRMGKPATWDAATLRFTGENAAEANTYLAREMRKPYDYSMV